MPPRKFISFDTWFGAMNNIRMSYELAAAISYITDRTLILPPKIFCLFLSDPNRKDTFWDFWELFDKEAFTSTFDTVDYEEVEPYAKFNSEQQYFDGICDEIRCLPKGEYPNWGSSTDITERISESELFTDDTFIHFPRNLFGHWYSLLPFSGDKTEEEFRMLLRKGLRIRSEFKPVEFEGPYNAIHVRMGDFNFTRPEATRKMRYHLNDYVSELMPKEMPLFIATNEPDRSFFDCLEGFDCHFLDETDAGGPVPAIAIDTLTCVEAERFHGSRFSTFTDYINILRHYKGYRDCSDTLLNYQFTGDEPESWENLKLQRY